MIDKLTFEMEKKAQETEELSSFSGIKLLNIKRNIEELLSLIGRQGIFDQYTRHDISHINAMLEILDWLVPKETQLIMSPADSLLTVLSIYFHDLGMVVSPQEFENRHKSGFPEFCDYLLSGDSGHDYRIKINGLSLDIRERFLYQEFVRKNHAERVRNWILGRASEHLGMTDQLMAETTNLLRPLSKLFIRDLALVCESHHCNDINNIRRYRLSQPYGNSEKETANIQYTAILLRAADLLNITTDRTPSMLFRVINPSDPISQEEWAKQMAVTCVRPQTGKDRDGLDDIDAPQDTIEIFAFFEKEDGFFGLNSYLSYAQNEIRKCHEWSRSTINALKRKYKFPWRFIDTSGIEANTFVRDPLKFTLSQTALLDILVGHTLYNDARVFLREILQNSIDATRFQKLKYQNMGRQYEGKIILNWETPSRTLSVEDNGIGMTMVDIEKYLFTIGASKYRTPDFIREYPEFSPISRFGIGFLSAFMVADSIEIITCNPDDEAAKLISLRSTHGNYLVKLLDKQSDNKVRGLLPHGTRISVNIRPSIDMGAESILTIAQHWAIIPNSDMLYISDNNAPVQIGYTSTYDALTDVLIKSNNKIATSYKERQENDLFVEHGTLDGVDLAIALAYQHQSDGWRTVSPDQINLKTSATNKLGICVEGIKVDSTPIMIDGKKVVAIINAMGKNAPKTNVVRSQLESSRESELMEMSILKIYRHIMGRINNAILTD